MILDELFAKLKKCNIRLALNDDQSLKVVGDRSLLTPELLSEIKQNKMDLITWLQQDKEQAPIKPVLKDNKGCSTSFSQQRLWLIDNLQGGSTEYNMPLVFKMHGQIDTALIKKVFEAIIERHEILRTVYFEQNGLVIQQIRSMSDIDFELTVQDLSDQCSDYEDGQLKERVFRDIQAPFNLAEDLMLRIGYYSVSSDTGILTLSMHHIASDGWSMEVLSKEFFTLYQAYANGLPNPLPALALQYSDFALWQRKHLGTNALEKQIAYWQTSLQGAPSLHSLPLRANRPEKARHRGALVFQSLPAEQVVKLRDVAQLYEVTPFMLLHSALALTLSKFSHSQDIVIGTPIANRMQSTLHDLIGFFANTLAFRVSTAHDTLEAYLQHIKQVHLGAQVNQDVPFEQLVDKLVSERSTAYSPLFQILMTMNSDFGLGQTNFTESVSLSGMTVTPFHTKQVQAKFDLSINFALKDSGLNINFIYNKDLFCPDFIEQISKYLSNTIKQLCAVATQHPAMELVGGLSQLDKQALLSDNNGEQLGNVSQLVHQQFEHYAAEHSDAPAVFFAQQQLTYGQLNARANQVANYLITQCGVKPDTLVGLCVERSIDMVVGMLGILKAGGAYVPLDPSYPKERLAFMLQDSQISHVLVSSEVNAKEIVTTHHTICVDDISQTYPSDRPQVNELTTNNLAYVLYTSGSTGKPKGVMVEHSSVCNFIDSMKQSFPIGPSDRVLGLTSMNFDIHVLELYLSLSTGSALVLANEEQQRAPEQLATLLLKHEVSLMQATPSSWKMLLDAGWQSSQVLTMLSGGEALPQELLKRLYAHCPAGRVFNMYGPTESTVWSSMGELKAGECHLGRPIANTQLLVLDSQQRLLPQGAIGELYISGAGLARGYLGQRELTQSRFVANPYYEPGKSWSSARLYKTGDLVRYNLQGQLEFKGRSDEQVKIHGHRIELAEIETQLAALEAVSSAVVIAAQVHGNNQLVGYVQPAEPAVVGDESVYVAQLKAQLSRVLPNYMVPNILLLQQQWPKTPNGKIDKKALPTHNAGGSQRQYVAPESDSEIKLAAIWQDVLGVSKISKEDNFFALGGNSIMAVQVSSKLKALGLELVVADMFQHPRLLDMAKALDESIQSEEHIEENILI
ncbi:amino acid adenylation domain-containing protein [Pseudoalteromonas sp. MMG013]|uniref:non-ribosomal peptide synthetase n=1 Tax=Pseudoalteromonas sp. MMG013 TaxID=2822687 RepID=UPI001B363F76|nr:non-ribosomal peptide synthetase [Pseudoalteromonas sp. MMG013]MBQ4862227.1 amino acid adenylation domain-containing protein [Pseudoalteromonas sp. MMG013]